MKKYIISLILLTNVGMPLLAMAPMGGANKEEEIEIDEPDISDIKKQVVNGKHTKFTISYTGGGATLVVSKKVTAAGPQYEIAEEATKKVVASGQTAKDFYEEMEELYNAELIS